MASKRKQIFVHTNFEKEMEKCQKEFGLQLGKPTPMPVVTYIIAENIRQNNIQFKIPKTVQKRIRKTKRKITIDAPY